MTDFAKAQLLKYGWTEGKGLGKNESGITDAIKPKLKFDLAGVGHKDEDWNEWWATSFNNAANNIIVQPQLHGVSISVSNENENESFKKHLTKKSFSYGNFLKTSTLFNGNSVQEDSANIIKQEEETKLDIKHVSLTDDELFKICGGRTAHKGARHGLKLNGKLKRIEEQEKNFLQKNSSKSEKDICDSDEDTLPINLPSEEKNIPKSSRSLKRSKKRLNDLTRQLSTLCNISDTDNTCKESTFNDESIQNSQSKRKKRKVRKESFLCLKKSIKEKKKKHQKNKKNNKRGVLHQIEKEHINMLDSTIYREISSTDTSINPSEDIDSFSCPESLNTDLKTEADTLNHKISRKKKAKFRAKEKRKIQNIMDGLEAVYLNTEDTSEKISNKKKLDTVIETMVGINIAIDKTETMQKRSKKQKRGKKKKQSVK
nr:G patch domain-containing protein 4 [Nomia melanderi]XP_031844440.1 G patch domain-containing protein 4 [Nomia melanderi]XP_031844441.1 G patch domain-containing protein 4 [Nomia melanderi]